MNDIINTLLDNMEKVIVGKREVLKRLLVALLNDGHVLIEDVPGVGKTQMVSSISKSINGVFHRIQFTPDVMPSDITGFSMLNPKTQSFEYKEGAAMCNFLLADEINRASSKTQSSLLEIMEEFQVTVDNNTYELPRPFMVLATQNPVESYGTYHLPEAQMDRFFLKLSIGYPEKNEEKQILDRYESTNPLSRLSNVVTISDILEMQKKVKEIKVKDCIKEYIVDISKATRNNADIVLGVSPRGSINLLKAAKAWAYINDREYVIPDDVQAMAGIVLAHRLMIAASAKARNVTGEELIYDAVKKCTVPLD